jgi:two-component system copper resistance phosphate regulon response regulator CusR
MRFLLVEDDEDTARYVTKGLGERGHVVDRVADGRSGLFQAGEVAYDALVVDRMLPGLDGLSLVRVLREAGVKTPVLFLTALGGLDDRVAGLDGGGDDYLAKPFAFVELLARVRTLLRRGPVREADRIEIEGLEIDLIRHRVTRAGQRIDLTPREFALLHFLARRHGEVLSRTQIASHVWDMNFDSDTNVVDVAIRRLRAKMDDHFAPKLIHSVRGIGYVLEKRQP